MKNLTGSSCLDIAQFIFRQMILLCLDIIKIFYGQEIFRTIMDILFYFFFLLFTSLKSNELVNNYNNSDKFQFKFSLKKDLFFVILLMFVFIELVSWMFMKAAFNTQAINAIDIRNILKEEIAFLPYIFVALLLIIFITFLPFYKKLIILPKITLVINHFHFIFLFIFILSILHDFQAKNNISLLDQSNDLYYKMLKQMLINKFDMEPKVLSTSAQLKNLFIMQLESFPNEFVQNSRISPNLNRYSKEFEYISPIQSQPYTTWSLAGTSTLQTGIPQIFPDVLDTLASQHDFEYITGIQGISNILNSYNYNIEYAVTGSAEIMGFDNWVKAHKYKRIYTAYNDLYLYDYMADQYLPMLDNRSRHSNYKNLTMTYAINIQTHSPYKRPIWFKRKSIDVPLKIHQCFFCCDFGVNKIIKKFLELKMYEHTLMVVVPDHIPYSLNEHELFFLFPGIQKVDSNLKLNINDISYYDFAPTILDLIGIKNYQPDFPFGRNIYLNSTDHSKFCINTDCIKKHEKPDANDLSIIYKFLHFERGRNIVQKYNLSKLFPCKINGTDNFYYSSEPCSKSTIYLDINHQKIQF